MLCEFIIVIVVVYRVELTKTAIIIVDRLIVVVDITDWVLPGLWRQRQLWWCVGAVVIDNIWWCIKLLLWDPVIIITIIIVNTFNILNNLLLLSLLLLLLFRHLSCYGPLIVIQLVIDLVKLTHSISQLLLTITLFVCVWAL